MRGISSSDEFALHMFMHCVMSQCLNFDKLIRPFPPYTHIYIFTCMWSIPALPNRMQNDQLYIIWALLGYDLLLFVFIHLHSFYVNYFSFSYLSSKLHGHLLFLFFLKEVLCKLWMGRVGGINKGLFDCKFSFKLHVSFCCDWMGIVCIFEKIIQAKL